MTSTTFKPKLMTVAEAMAYLGLSRTTLTRYMDTGLLTRYNIGLCHVGLDPAEVEALIRPAARKTA
jgi:predicted site-specific integrase-resolvase